MMVVPRRFGWLSAALPASGIVAVAVLVSCGVSGGLRARERGAPQPAVALVPAPAASAADAPSAEEEEPEDPDAIDTSNDAFEQSQLPEGCEKLFIEHATFCDALRTVAAAASLTHEYHRCFEVEPLSPKPVFPRPPRTWNKMLCNLEPVPVGRGHRSDCRSAAARRRNPMPSTVVTCGLTGTDYAELARRQQDLESCFPVRKDLSFEDEQWASVSGMRTVLTPKLHQLWFSYDHEGGMSGPSLLTCVKRAVSGNDRGPSSDARDYRYSWDLFFFDLKAHR